MEQEVKTWGLRDLSFPMSAREMSTVVMRGLGRTGLQQAHRDRSTMFRRSYVQSVWMTAVPGRQRFSDEDFVEASDREETRLGEALVEYSCL